jgi:serine/threonine protein kinase
VLVHNNGDNLEFKITDFSPCASMELPMQSEANYWPFAKNKKSITEREKMEVLMLKDVYSLGICLLEMMIGRFSKNKFSISLDSLPLTWAEFPESTPLIQVLVECIQIDSITSRKGKLQSIRKLLTREYKKYFQKQFYKLEAPFIGKKSDSLNKKGIISLFHKKDTEQKACGYWQEALSLNDRHFDSKCNEVMYRWSTAKIGDHKMMAELEEFVF